MGCTTCLSFGSRLSSFLAVLRGGPPSDGNSAVGLGLKNWEKILGMLLQGISSADVHLWKSQQMSPKTIATSLLV